MAALFRKLWDKSKDRKPVVVLEGNRKLELAGLKYYEDALRRVVMRNTEERARVHFTATVVLEWDNVHDANAIAIYGEGRMIGHLAREDAAKYRSALETLAVDSTIQATGIIYAGHHGGKTWRVSVVLPKQEEM